MTEFPSGKLKHQRVVHDPTQLISLKDYCDSVHCSRGAAMHRISYRKVIAYKLSGRWWVLPDP